MRDELNTRKTRVSTHTYTWLPHIVPAGYRHGTVVWQRDKYRTDDNVFLKRTNMTSDRCFQKGPIKRVYNVSVYGIGVKLPLLLP